MSAMVRARNAARPSGVFEGDEERPGSQVGINTAFVRAALRRPNVRYATRQFSIVAPLPSRHVPRDATVAGGGGGGGAGRAWPDAALPNCSAARAAARQTYLTVVD